MKDIVEKIFKTGKGLKKVTKEDLVKIFNALKERGVVKEGDKAQFILTTVEKLENKGIEISHKLKEMPRSIEEKGVDVAKKVKESIEKAEQKGRHTVKKVKETVTDRINPKQKINDLNRKIDELVKELDNCKKDSVKPL
jgi:hypothetical protein